MKLIRLGDYIEQIDIRNADNNYKSKDVMGISVNKILIPTKAKVDNLELKNYKIFGKGQFSYCLVTSRNGNKISIVYNDYKNCIISSINPIFKIKNEKSTELNPYFLFMYFKRKDFDRYARYNSWGSARETFSWEDFCDIQIPLPPIEIQNKYVDIYKAMNENLKVYESNLEDLKLLKDILLNIDISKERIGNRIEETNEKNILGLYTKEKGIGINKEFIETKAKASNIMTQKIVNQYEFAFNSNTSRNSNKISIAYNEKEPYILSNTYVTFKCNHKELSSKYLFLWFTQENFDRYARYNSWGSARETISLNEIKDYKIAIPELKVQTSIVAIFESYKIRESKVKKIRNFIDNICPILIAGAIKEAKASE